jgi:hypothetical protein
LQEVAVAFQSEIGLARSARRHRSHFPPRSQRIATQLSTARDVGPSQPNSIEDNFNHSDRQANSFTLNSVVPSNRIVDELAQFFATEFGCVAVLIGPLVLNECHKSFTD